MTAEFEDIIPDRVAYMRGFLSPESSTRLMQELIETSPWSQERLTVRGLDVPFPRLVAWHGDPGVGYRYSGIIHPPADWTPPLLTVRSILKQVLGVEPNGVLLNRYRDGNDSIGRHADREDDLVEGSPIIGVSLGVSRTIIFRKNSRDRIWDETQGKPVPSRETKRLELEDGSLLLMYGDCQKTWTHEIKKQPDRPGTRISLTFRTVKV